MKRMSQETNISTTDEDTLSIFIPKIVMQTWKTTTVPDIWKDGQKSVIDLNTARGWKYVLMTDTDNRNFICDHFPEYLECYDQFEYNIQRVDFIRYAWLYVHGGVYIDLDYEMYIPFDEIIQYMKDKHGCDHEAYIPRTSESANAFMISVPKCRFWIHLMNSIVNEKPHWYQSFEKHLYILYTTGPKRLLNCVVQYGYGNRIGDIPKELFPTCSICSRDSVKMSAKKLEGCSWITPTAKLFTKVWCNSEMILFIILLIVLIFYVWIYFGWDRFFMKV